MNKGKQNTEFRSFGKNLAKYPIIEALQRDIARAYVYTVDDDGSIKYLLLKTKKGYRQSPQGGIDPGETSQQAAIRELFEETNIKTKIKRDAQKVSTKYNTERKGRFIYTEVYGYPVCISDISQLNIQLSEEDGHTEFGRYTYDEIIQKNMLRFTEQISMLKDINNQINKENKQKPSN